MPSDARMHLANLLHKLMAVADECDDSERPGLQVAIAIVEWHMRGHDA